MLSNLIADFIIIYTSGVASETSGTRTISDLLELHPITSSVVITSIITSLILLL